MRLNYNHDRVHPNLTDLTNSMQSCTSLDKLYVAMSDRMLSEDFIKALLPASMHSLEPLALLSRKKGKTPALFGRIARLTCKLKHLHLDVFSAISPTSMLAIFQANPGLAFIDIVYEDRHPEYLWTSCDGIETNFKASLLCKARSVSLTFRYKCSFESEARSFYSLSKSFCFFLHAVFSFSHPP